MNKILLIIKREYLTRVRKRSFIIMSLIGPVLMAGMFVIPIWLATRQSEKRTIRVLDESGYFINQVTDQPNIEFIYIQSDISEAKKELNSEGAYGLLYIPDIDINDPAGITFFCDKNPSLEVIDNIQRILRSRIEDVRLERSEISKEFIESLKSDLTINSINISESGEKASSAGIATVVGYISSLLIYFFILFYGIQVLRGVTEEKTSRIVEIIISSVKPFQLMTGKILGIGAVGITQFAIWVILGTGLTSVIGYFIGADKMAAAGDSSAIPAQASPDPGLMNELLASIGTVNLPLIFIAFLFYFIGAYILYGALFAAIGAAVDSDADAQQFQWPVTIPLIISIIVLAAVLKEPDGSLAFWMSIIPLFSPIVMMMRLPFHVPAWELYLSMGLLIAGSVFTIWLAGRIYR
ncbi:MAG TPA: ABC transporter permease, partial [Cyclobacteriaceae bacterium]|nr:ABC transporter permease [Cyclobacteriaceae bacterium]